MPTKNLYLSWISSTRILNRLEYVIVGIISLTLFGCAQIPQKEMEGLPANLRYEFNKYLNNPNYINFKSFAIGESTKRWGRSWASISPEEAVINAKRLCEKNGEKCITYSIGNTVVYGMNEDQIESVLEQYYQSIVDEVDRSIPSKRLSSSEILSKLSNKTFDSFTANGLKITIHFNADGFIKGKLKTNVYRFPYGTDHGEWEVSSGEVCTQWTHWLNGTKNCYRIFHENNVLKAYKSDGRYFGKYIPF
ncbi:MAG: hypothetical protein ABW079_15325 [Sedimenticola sp.]